MTEAWGGPKDRLCPDCGQVPHNPKTGFCWKSTSRNPRSGFHCKHCCVISSQPKKESK